MKTGQLIKLLSLLPEDLDIIIEYDNGAEIEDINIEYIDDKVVLK